MPKIIHNQDLTPELIAALPRNHREWIYNALDCCLTHEIHTVLQKEADNIALNTVQFSYDLAAPVFEMTLRGTLIDEGKRKSSLKQLKADLEKIEHNLSRLVVEGLGFDPAFNPRSNAQWMKIFYTIMGIKPILKRNANGDRVPTVDRDALEKIALYLDALPLVNHLIALRELDKKIQVLENELDADGRMRTSYNIAGTTSGRLSSSISDFDTGGNMQNIERALREMFVCDPGMKFCNVDLEQGDARNVGAICWEVFVESHGEAFAGSYLDACESGDLHTTVCRMAWPDLPWGDDPSKWKSIADVAGSWYRTFSFRDGAKKLGHGTNYYGTPPTMAMHTKVQPKLIEDFQVKYFGGFPVIGAVKYNDRGRLVKDTEAICWHNWVREQLEQTGQLTTPYFNRRRFFFGREDNDQTLREAIAHCPQSMTADEIDTGMIRLWRWGKVQLLIQVHDSILFQYPAHLEEEIIPKALELLTIRIPLKKGREFIVPCEAKIGFNWYDVQYNADKTVKANPFGLMKWKGPGVDTRKRPDYNPAKKFLRLQDFI